MDTGWIVALTGAAGTLAGAIGAFLINWLKERHGMHRQNRADAISEWREITDRQQEEIVALIKRESECRTEVAGLHGEIRLLQQSVLQIQERTGNVAPAQTAAIVVASLDGTILSVSPAIGPLLHWLPQDLFKRSVDVLVPERIRAQHRAALAKVAQGNAPWPERTILTHALTRTGQEVPVSIRLYGWQTPAGEWLVSAEISRRVGSTDQGGEPTPFPPQPAARRPK